MDDISSSSNGGSNGGSSSSSRPPALGRGQHAGSPLPLLLPVSTSPSTNAPLAAAVGAATAAAAVPRGRLAAARAVYNPAAAAGDATGRPLFAQARGMGQYARGGAASSSTSSSQGFFDKAWWLQLLGQQQDTAAAAAAAGSPETAAARGFSYWFDLDGLNLLGERPTGVAGAILQGAVHQLDGHRARSSRVMQ